MAFDPATASPVKKASFDPSTASPVRSPQSAREPNSLWGSETLGEAGVNLAGAAAEPMMTLATGLVAQPVAGWVGIITGIANELGLTETEAADAVRATQEALTYSPKTQGGKDALTGITYPFRKFDEATTRLGETVTDVTGNPALGTAAKVAPDAVLAALGIKGGSKLGSPKAGSAQAKVASGTKAVAEFVPRKSAELIVEAKNIVDPHLPGGTMRTAKRASETVAGPRAPAVRAALDNPPPNPLGIPKSSGQLAARAGSPEYSAFQKMLEQRKPAEYMQLAEAADEARLAGLKKISGSADDLDVAISLRRENSKKGYAEAHKEIVRGDDAIKSILKRVPRAAFTKAMDLAKTEGNQFSINPRPIKGKRSFGSMAERQAQMSPKAEGYSVRDLDYVKRGIDDLISETAAPGMKSSQNAARVQLKTELVNWLDEKSPKYKSVREQYAKDSIPINQMKIGRALEAKLATPLEVGQRPAGFANAVNESSSLIKKSTGDPRYKSLSEVMNPEQMQIIDEIMKSLKDDALYEAQASKGDFMMKQRLEQVIPPIPPPGFFSPIVTVARNAINRLSGHSKDKVLDLLADIHRNPADSARLHKILTKATPAEKKVIYQVLRLNKNQAVVGGAVNAAGRQDQ